MSTIAKGFIILGRSLGLNRLIFIRTLWDSIIRVDLPFPVSVQGSYLYCSPLRIYLKGIHEPETTNWSKAHISKGAIVADLGGAFGYYTMLFARLVGAEGHVYVFEPSPRSAKNIRRGIEKNNLKNITLTQGAVSDKEGEAVFYVHGEGTGTDSLIESKKGDVRMQKVKTITIDRFFQGKKVDVMKIDVEGAELAVLEGGKSFFSQNAAPALLMEVSPKNLYEAHVDLGILLESIWNFGYKIMVIDSDGNTRVVNTVEEVEQVVKKHGGHINVLCKK